MARFKCLVETEPQPNLENDTFTNIMSKAVKIGDSVVGKVGVSSPQPTCDGRKFLNFDHVAWRNAAHNDSQSCSIRPSVRHDQGCYRCYAPWCETLYQQWYVGGLFASISSQPLIGSVGEFYGFNPRSANLDLLAEFYGKHPEYREKTFLSVKGGCDGREESIRRSVENINKHLRGTKRLDLFECARVDSTVPIEETIGTLRKLIEEGKFSYIGMSEASSATLRKAHAVGIFVLGCPISYPPFVQVHPIAAVEIELSPWSYENEAKKGMTLIRCTCFALC